MFKYYCQICYPEELKSIDISPCTLNRLGIFNPKSGVIISIGRSKYACKYCMEGKDNLYYQKLEITEGRYKDEQETDFSPWHYESEHPNTEKTLCSMATKCRCDLVKSKHKV